MKWKKSAAEYCRLMQVLHMGTCHIKEKSIITEFIIMDYFFFDVTCPRGPTLNKHRPWLLYFFKEMIRLISERSLKKTIGLKNASFKCYLFLKLVILMLNMQRILITHSLLCDIDLIEIPLKWNCLINIIIMINTVGY